MGKPHIDTEQWMLVFAVPRGAKIRFAAHPTEAKTRGYDIPAKLQTLSEKSWQRIGTASKCEDGSFVLDLTKIPETTHLVIRPARVGETV